MQESHGQIHWVAPRLNQPFILPRLTERVPQISGNFFFLIKAFLEFHSAFLTCFFLMKPPLSFGLLLRGQVQRSNANAVVLLLLRRL